MAIIGQGVQAGLGRIDYSPYLQGAAAGAQGIAQGVAQFGQSVSTGIQNYLKKEQEKKLEAEGVEYIKSQFPGIDDKAAKAGLKFYGGPAQYAKFRNDQQVFEMQKRESELRLGELQRTIAERNKLEQFLTQTPAEAAIGAGTSFENLPTGAAAFLPRQYGNAQELLVAGQRAGIPVSQLLPVATGMASLGKTEAEAAALRVPKPEKTPTGAEADIAAKVKSFTSKFGRAPNDTEYEQIRDAVNASRKPTNITNVGPGLSTAIYNDLAKEKSDLFALREAVENYDTALNEITGSKAFSGPAGAIKYAGARALQMFGSDAFKSEADAYQAAGSALASSVLSIARQLPGASSDRDVIFLERVARGDERVPSAEVLMKIKARVEAKVARLDSSLQSKIQAFGEASKGDPNSEFAFKILSAKPRTQVPSLPSNF
jgi:hypothetical protein